MKYVLSKCDWFDVNNYNSDIKMDEYCFTFVNTNRLLFSNEPDVLPSQV